MALKARPLVSCALQGTWPAPDNALFTAPFSPMWTAKSIYDKVYKWWVDHNEHLDTLPPLPLRDVQRYKVIRFNAKETSQSPDTALVLLFFTIWNDLGFGSLASVQCDKSTYNFTFPANQPGMTVGHSSCMISQVGQ